MDKHLAYSQKSGLDLLMDFHEQLYNEIKNCTKCPNLRHGVIWTKGTDGTVLFIAIQPSWPGHPNNPKMRKSLMKYFDSFWKMKEESGLGACRFTNFVKCATDNPSIMPNMLEINNCFYWLRREVEEFKTKYIVVVGKDWYPFWKEYLETTLNVKSNWCYHYSGKNANRSDYPDKQGRQLGLIYCDVKNLLPHFQGMVS